MWQSQRLSDFPLPRSPRSERVIPSHFPLPRCGGEGRVRGSAGHETSSPVREIDTRRIARGTRRWSGELGLRCAALMALIAFSGLAASKATAQSDTIKRWEGRDLKCKIGQISPEKVTYEISGQTAEILPNEIQAIEFAGEPKELDRARLRLSNGQYADCLTELQKVDLSGLSQPIQAEHSYLAAKAETRKAMVDGSTTTRDAARLVADALKNFPTSYHYYEWLEDFGTLAFHAGEVAVAEKQFQDLSRSSVPSYALRGNLHLGRVQLELGKVAEAQAALQQVVSSPATDNFAQDAKLIARCLVARTQASSDGAAAALQQLQEIIAAESPERKLIFAHCYNAMGACHLALNDPKNAVLDFLHTDLLFASEGELHAEALYYLADLWSQLGETDRAARAKQTLSQQYRNSYWASKQ